MQDPIGRSEVGQRSYLRSLRSDNATLSLVGESLAGGRGDLANARTKLAEATDLLKSIKDNLVAALGTGADLGTLQGNIDTLQRRLARLVDGEGGVLSSLLATNSDAPELDPNPSYLGYRSLGGTSPAWRYDLTIDRSLTALIDLSESVDGILERGFGNGAAAVAPSTAGLGGTGSQVQGLDRRTPSTAGLSGLVTQVAGLAANPPSLAGLSGTATIMDGVSSTGQPSTNGLSGALSLDVRGLAGERAEVNLGVVNLSGIDRRDVIQFLVRSNGGGVKMLSMDLTDVRDNASFAAALQKALDDQYNSDSDAENGLKVSVAADRSIRITSEFAESRENASFVRIYDFSGKERGTNTDTSFSAGLAGKDLSDSGTRGTPASIVTGSGFSGPVTLQSGASLEFDLSVNGAVTHVKLTRDLVDSALGRSGGTISSAGDLAIVVSAALAAQSVTSVSVAADGNRLRFTKTGIAATGDRLRMSNLVSTAAPSTYASLITGSDFAGPIVVAENAAIRIEGSLDGSSMGTVRITKALVDRVLGRADGTISTVAAFAQVVETALHEAGGNAVSVVAEGARLRLAKTTAGNGSLRLDAVVAESNATIARTTTGSDFVGPLSFADGAAIAFDLDTGSGARTVRIDRAIVEAALTGTSGYTAGSATVSDMAQYVLVVRQALAAASIADIAVSASGQRLSFSRSTAGAGSLSIGNVQASPSSGRAASTRSGSDFAGPITLTAGATLGFDLTIDGTRRAVTITKETVEAALASDTSFTAGSGRIASIGQLAAVVGEALRRAGVATVDVVASGARLELRSRTSSVSTLGIDAVTASAGLALSERYGIDDIDIGQTALGGATRADRSAFIRRLVAGVEDRIEEVAASDSYLALWANQVNIQERFVARIRSIVSRQIVDLIDFDMDQTAAERAALEARQTLMLKVVDIRREGLRGYLLLLEH
ncbi:MAG: hypothetical protein ABW179_03905 [Methylobacterium sp.]